MMDINEDKISSVLAEVCVINSMIFDPELYDEVVEVIAAKDFYNQRNRMIFEVICDLKSKDLAVDVVTVAARFGEITGKNELSEMARSMADSPSMTNAIAYVLMVKEKSLIRDVIAAADKIRSKALSGEPDIEAVIEFAQSTIMNIEGVNTGDDNVTETKDAVKKLVDDIDKRFNSDEEIIGMKTGFDDLDEKLGGIQPGLIILAARPSMGKSTFAQQLGLHMSRNDNAGLLFSLEMSDLSLAKKAVSSMGKVDLNDINKPKSAGEDFWPLLEAGARRTMEGDIRYVQCAGIGINELKIRARKLHAQRAAKWIVIDHLHIMDYGKNGEVAGIGDITRGLKALQVELGIPVILLAQLSRGVEERPDKRPVVRDLRASGSIEQDADVIIFLYRDDYYNEDMNNPNAGLVEANIAKQREGALGRVYLEHHLGQSRFEPTKRFMSFGGGYE